MSEIETPFPKIRKNLRRVINLHILSKAVIIALAILGVVFILLAISIIGWLRADTSIAMQPPVSDNVILTVNFDKPLPEHHEDDILSPFPQEPQFSFYEMIKTLNIAATDDRIKALSAEINVSALGAAQIQELRRTIKYFRSKGKKAYIYSSGMGSFGGGTSEYYLASAFDEIWMQPNTEIGITGINIEVPFIRDTLDKIGVTPEFYARYEYKNAMASLLDKKLSPQYKSEINKLGGTMYVQMLQGIANDREIELNKMLELVNKAPIIAEDGLKNKLIDKTAFKNDYLAEIRKQNDNAELYPLSYYVHQVKDMRGRLPVIAMLVLEGEIVEGRDGEINLWRSGVISDTHVIKQLEEISKLSDVKGLVVRINSPGGSYSASAEIWHAINNLKKNKKIPVVVTMGDTAASGGYFIALAGDYIFAEPLTLTGSIGVLGGKMVFADLWKKLGIHWAGMQFGENAGILSSNRPFSYSEKAAFNRSLDNVYKDFTTKVAAVRNISLQELNKLARGRVWPGVSAVQNKLVDANGGIGEALLKVSELIGGEENARYRVVTFPRAKTLPEKINELLHSTPRISLQSLAQESGLPIREFQMLRRLQYDAVMLPLDIAM